MSRSDRMVPVAGVADYCGTRRSGLPARTRAFIDSLTIDERIDLGCILAHGGVGPAMDYVQDRGESRQVVKFITVRML